MMYCDVEDIKTLSTINELLEEIFGLLENEKNNVIEIHKVSSKNKIGFEIAFSEIEWKIRFCHTNYQDYNYSIYNTMDECYTKTDFLKERLKHKGE